MQPPRHHLIGILLPGIDGLVVFDNRQWERVTICDLLALLDFFIELLKIDPQIVCIAEAVGHRVLKTALEEGDSMGESSYF